MFLAQTDRVTAHPLCYHLSSRFARVIKAKKQLTAKWMGVLTLREKLNSKTVPNFFKNVVKTGLRHKKAFFRFHT